MASLAHILKYSIDSVSTIVGENISADDWARSARVPDRKNPGRFLDGADVTRITGVERKAWDPNRFRDLSPVVDATKQALARAHATVDDIDAVIIVTSTPYWPQLDMDGFELLRRLGFPDHLPPLQLQAGCAAMARVMLALASMKAERPLIIAYTASSPYMSSPIYFENTTHPLRSVLWMSSALFADGAGAMVLRRRSEPTGCVVYSRDSHSFGDEPAFDDPLIHYLGGGAMAAPGFPNSQELAVFAMNGPATQRYYQKGMILNHCALEEQSPGYIREVKRIYMHQASPRVVDFVRRQLVEVAGADLAMLPTNAHLQGNLVAPATLKLLDDDWTSGAVKPGDRVCFSVVGAGPERGGFIVPLSTN